MMFALYPSKKELKASVGQPLKYRETSFFGEEYRENGKFCVANRPSMTGIGKEFFAEVTMVNGLIRKVS
jgi:hypothetical protein